jgi:glucosamine--fructose-6-phosphate aminotransferase (isomerizing)
MCGIVGYVGSKPAYPILISGLKRLEYRGYDSAGVALLVDKNLQVFKKEGKVAALEGLVGEQQPLSKIGIGHTRWANLAIEMRTLISPMTVLLP